MKYNKMIRIGVMVLCAVIICCVWPVCIFRRTMNVDAVAVVDWKSTANIASSNENLEQFFIAQTSRLEYIAIVVECYGDFQEDDSLFFELCDSDGEIVVSDNISFDDIESNKYYYIPIGKWITKGEEYSYRLSVSENCKGEMHGVYTEQSEGGTGSTRYVVGDLLIDGEAYTRYGYGYPMNIKNVICIWAFILTIGLTICNALKGVTEKDEKVA